MGRSKEKQGEVFTFTDAYYTPCSAMQQKQPLPFQYTFQEIT